MRVAIALELCIASARFTWRNGSWVVTCSHSHTISSTTLCCAPDHMTCLTPTSIDTIQFEEAAVQVRVSSSSCCFLDTGALFACLGIHHSCIDRDVLHLELSTLQDALFFVGYSSHILLFCSDGVTAFIDTLWAWLCWTFASFCSRSGTRFSWCDMFWTAARS